MDRIEGLKLRSGVVFQWVTGGAFFGAVALALWGVEWTFPTAAFIVLGFLLAIALYVHDLQKLQIIVTRQGVRGQGTFHWLGLVPWEDILGIEERLMGHRKVVELLTQSNSPGLLNSDLRVLVKRRRWVSAGKITLAGDSLQGGHAGLLQALRKGWEASRP